MPRWPEGYVKKTTCPICGGHKWNESLTCRGCQSKPQGLLGRKGPDHPAWKGGFQVDRDGYIRTYDPTHPWPRKGGYVLEHVRVMELKIGRRITQDENVHHKDENRQNNDLGNLELLSKRDHSSLHAKRIAPTRKRDGGRFC